MRVFPFFMATLFSVVAGAAIRVFPELSAFAALTALLWMADSLCCAISGRK